MSIARMRAAVLAASLAISSSVSARDVPSAAAPVVAPPFCADGAVAPQIVRQLIEREAAQQGVDIRLALAIADQESGFGQRVNSSAGARGPMQLMPETAARYHVADICDAADNIRGGISYLKDLASLFGGNIMLIVAAYNSGQNRVVASGGIPAIRETVSYTALVTNAYYGFDNAMKGGRRARQAGKPALQNTGAGVDLLAQTPSSDQPIPINQTGTRNADRDWIGGSVLYVQ